MIEAYNNRALLTDLYELTMAAAYFEHRVPVRATFELFVRQLPPERSYLVAAGLDSGLGYLENLQFTEDDVAFLRGLPGFRTVSDEFFNYLRNFRFTGDIHGVPEGTLIFGGEPILQVTAPIAEAQIVETYLLSVLNFETLIASKAARVVSVAGGRKVWEFGTRRAHGPQAGVRAARAAYVGGCAGTSNVLAGYLYGVPTAGTAAHSWTQSYPSERESFLALLETFPDATLLIDTYDTLAGAQTAATLGRPLAGVRIDSGDLLEKGRRVREILDRHGLRETKIFASGDLNEYKIQELVANKAPIDAFGVGTDLATSRDVPALGVVYKLVEVEHDGQVEYKTKFSEQKAHWPGRKQIFRFSRTDGDGRQIFHHDLITCCGEDHPEGAPLLEPVMRAGHRLEPPHPIREARARALAGLERLPERYKSLHDGPRYPVGYSARLERLREEVRRQYVTAPEVPDEFAAHANSDAGRPVVFLDVDTQVDFMSPSGALYVPGAEQIIPNLKRLMEHAREQGIPVISSADAHAPDDPSFSEWPPHCVVGTPGQHRIPATQSPSALRVPNLAGAFRPALDRTRQIVLEIEKQAYSVAANPNFEAVLAALGASRFIVFGVATEYCVKESALALREMGLPVDLVVDAIRPITEEGGRDAIKDMLTAGVHLVTTEEVCAQVLQLAGAGSAIPPA
ncbi:MAG TPA: nicotinate phosphoribosyltransferase [Terriglobia bacterium]|nr:nicotinate phosphoribosyltransferase [Terriglobia bacterium]